MINQEKSKRLYMGYTEDSNGVWFGGLICFGDFASYVSLMIVTARWIHVTCGSVSPTCFRGPKHLQGYLVHMMYINTTYIIINVYIYILYIIYVISDVYLYIYMT